MCMQCNAMQCNAMQFNAMQCIYYLHNVHIRENLTFFYCLYPLIGQLYYMVPHGLLIEYGPICHIVKLPISMICPFSLVNNSHITLYPSIRNYLEGFEIYTQILEEIWTILILYYKLYITRDCIIVENIFLV